MYKKDKVALYELISGHPAHNALRAGTSNWPSNVVMAKALEKSLKGLAMNYPKLKECQQKILTKLSEIKEITINTNASTCIPGMINFSLIGYNPEVIIRYLSNKEIYVSSRSVCSAEKKDTVSSTLFAIIFLNAASAPLRNSISTLSPFLFVTIPFTISEGILGVESPPITSGQTEITSCPLIYSLTFSL